MVDCGGFCGVVWLFQSHIWSIQKYQLFCTGNRTNQTILQRLVEEGYPSSKQLETILGRSICFFQSNSPSSQDL
jgi:hypothetical protein